MYQNITSKKVYTRSIIHGNASGAVYIFLHTNTFIFIVLFNVFVLGKRVELCFVLHVCKLQIKMFIFLYSCLFVSIIISLCLDKPQLLQTIN